MQIKTKNRITIPIEDYNLSNLKGHRRVVFVWESENKIALYPETKRVWETKMPIFSTYIDAKRRIELNKNFAINMKERLGQATMFLEKGQIVIELQE